MAWPLGVYLSPRPSLSLHHPSSPSPTVVQEDQLPELSTKAHLYALHQPPPICPWGRLPSQAGIDWNLQATKDYRVGVEGSVGPNASFPVGISEREKKEMGVSQGPALTEEPDQLTAKALAGQDENA